MAGPPDSLEDTLLEQTRHPLASLPRFYGAGVYAIYYTGDFDAYAPISGTDNAIYVGKADPSNPDAETPSQQGDKLWQRLYKDHYQKSIAKVDNLCVEDFQCRYLVVRSRWQTTAEAYLISRFKPIWNDEMNVCYGIGKHGDAPERRSNTRSPWDTLHPGRPWAWVRGNRPNPQTPEQIKQRIAQHFANFPPER